MNFNINEFVSCLYRVQMSENITHLGMPVPRYGDIFITQYVTRNYSYHMYKSVNDLAVIIIL